MDPAVALSEALHAPTRAEREAAATAFLAWADRGGFLPPGATPGTIAQVRAIAADRARRERRSAQARARRAIYRDVADSLGLSVVRGPVSGRLYLE